jgi:nicotinamide mononucleotide transporter
MIDNLELIAVLFGLIYLVLLIKEKIACWIFGILSSLLSIYLFYSIQLYNEAILYFYYVIIGIYGFWLWSTKGVEKKSFQIKDFKLRSHLITLVIGIVLSLLSGYLVSAFLSDASSPYLDSFTTIFSFIASYLQAKKILSSFIYWIVINAATLYLYLHKELWFYFFLTVVYFIFSFVGFITWQRKMALQR